MGVSTVVGIREVKSVSYRTAVRMGLGHHDAEDIAQDVELSMLGQSQSVRPIVTKRRVIDHLRNKYARQRIAHEYAKVRSFPTQQTHISLEDINGLLVYRYMFGYQVNELASMNQVSPQTIRRHIHHRLKEARQ